MFTDVVGFTTSVQEDEARALQLLQEEEGLVRPLLQSWEGREVKSTGDGFLVEFDSALRAVQCANEILEHLEERNSRSGVTPIRLRIGIHLGDVEARGGDIFGDAVNIASRIQPLAPPGGLCITGQVFDQVRNKLPNRFEKLPPTVLKHVKLPIDVYRVSPGDGREVSQPAGAPRTRLAVLPLSNISPDPKDEYFADGLTEELIGSLSKLRELRVIARTSVGQYKATSKPVSQIGAELGVGTVLEGSVRKAGTRLRISLQLIDTATQEHVWVDTYDRELDDVFAIQTDVAERTAAALRLELLGSERESLQKRPTSNLAAYDWYLKGIHSFRQPIGEMIGGRTESINFFEEAIKEDPGFSLAYSTLANSYIAFAGMVLDPKEAFPRARQLVTKALELDPDSADAHTARGNLAFQFEHDWPFAEQEFRRAIALNPSNSSAHFWYSMLLGMLQRVDEAMAEVRTTIELDPLWDLPRNELHQIYLLRGELDSAVTIAEEAVARNPEDPFPRISLAVTYLQAGRREEAQKELELTTGHGNWFLEIGSAIAWALLGQPERARALAARGPPSDRYLNPSILAQLYVSIGETDKALDLLERDQSAEGSTLPIALSSPGFDPIRGEPRFQALLRKFDLPLHRSGPFQDGRAIRRNQPD
jgi:adenylate cyclase